MKKLIAAIIIAIPMLWVAVPLVSLQFWHIDGKSIAILNLPRPCGLDWCPGPPL